MQAYHQIFDYHFSLEKITFNNLKPNTQGFFKYSKKIKTINSTKYIVLKKNIF